MAHKLTTLFTIALLLSFQLTYAARPEPAFTNNGLKTQHHDQDMKIFEEESDNCEGIADEEECLMRRTLAAHVDYIYTQKHKP